MTELESDFEDKLTEALLDTAETQLEEAAEQLKRVAEENFKDYAARNGYDIEHIWQDAAVTNVERSPGSVSVRVEWPELTALFEFGVGPHIIRGSPLAFEWQGPPEGTRPPGAPKFVQTDKVNWGSVTGGIDESRAIRSALDVVRVNLGGTVTR
jgi:hypothetical protein